MMMSVSSCEARIIWTLIGEERLRIDQMKVVDARIRACDASGDRDVSLNGYFEALRSIAGKVGEEALAIVGPDDPRPRAPSWPHKERGHGGQDDDDKQDL